MSKMKRNKSRVKAFKTTKSQSELSKAINDIKINYIRLVEHDRELVTINIVSENVIKILTGFGATWWQIDTSELGVIKVKRVHNMNETYIIIGFIILDILCLAITKFSIIGLIGLIAFEFIPMHYIHSINPINKIEKFIERYLS